MNKHAPEPWGIHPEKLAGERHWWVYANEAPRGHRLVAMCSGPDGKANARLIAAAPRMLELLHLCMDDDDTRQGPLGEAYRAILHDVEG